MANIGSGFRFSGCITNLGATGNAVLQALIISKGKISSAFIRPGDCLSINKMLIDKISVVPATSQSTDSGSASSVYAKVYGVLLKAETATEEMHLDANSYIEYHASTTFGGVQASAQGFAAAAAVAAGAAIFAAKASLAGVLRVNFLASAKTTIGMAKNRGSTTLGGATKLINSGAQFNACNWYDIEVPVEACDTVTWYSTCCVTFCYSVDNFANAD